MFILGCLNRSILKLVIMGNLNIGGGLGSFSHGHYLAPEVKQRNETFRELAIDKN